MTAPKWVTRGINWRDSLTPAVTQTSILDVREPRVFNVSVASPAAAARELSRIYNSRRLFDDARQSPIHADLIDAPLDIPTGGDRGANKSATPKVAVPKTETPSPTVVVPSTPKVAPPVTPPINSEPTATTPMALQQLGVLPGVTEPVAVPNYPQIAPGSQLPVVAATALPENSSIQQTSTTSNGVTVTETTVTTPGLSPVTTTKITDDPVVSATVECTVPVPLAQPGVLPPSITSPQTIFRTGSDYSRQQLEADLRTFEAGQLVWVGPNGPTPYDVARARLAAAMYTPGEQFNDLVWANHIPRSQTEIAERSAAIQRLNRAGIPWLDPAVATWVADQQQITVAADPFSPPRNTRPSMYSPAELRRQALEASRTELTANDLKQGLNDVLVGVTVGPALILWDAAHDRGDYSGAEIAWAAAELGINTASIVPGLGTLTGAAAKAGLRRIAPKTWEALAAADNAVDAARIGATTQQRQLGDAVENYRQRATPHGAPARTAGPSPAPRLNDPDPTVAAPRMSAAPTEPMPVESQSTRLRDRAGEVTLPTASRPAVPSYSPFSPYLNPGRFDDLKAALVRLPDRIRSFAQALGELEWTGGLYPASVGVGGRTFTTGSVFSASSPLRSAPAHPGLSPRWSGRVRNPDNNVGPVRPRASEPLLLDFHYGVSPGVRAKPLEMVDQLTGQINGLNNLTAAEVVSNLSTAHRGGNAQKNARKQYENLAVESEKENAQRLALLNPAALNGLSPTEYAEKIVKDRMKGMAALHEPDIIGGGADVIRLDSSGLPRLGDLGVNSSIGSQWKGRNHLAIRMYAQNLVASGRGHELMNVEWRLNP
ncbi:polymorphic toxin type 15 domain-containing protein [Nocardia asteroides]|uniref:polymorphic toxin type 15 domain-containing protein n=1 Tax=Nocardia asteroides TaxID=1824 RepID=UPI001E556CD8|nr:polymorphic toxin type 15 domain-containing protein [Nocardia asteroides]UGT53259.1 polymorphic toxin type 15 domain-containing protein [Nocardia asteroides]